ncbi:MAG: glycosyltransferase family 2 protein [Anaerolineae bacterium]
MELSIVIINWNTQELLARCLDSVYANPPAIPFEVLVVDNASTDGSATMVQRRFPQVRLMVNDDNVGFAQANNQAIRHSKGDYVLLLNSDTKVKPHALNRLLDFLKAHPQAGAVGARILNPDGSLQTSCYPRPTLAREFWRLFHLDTFYPYGSYAMANWDAGASRTVDALLGACILLRRTALEQVGALDEDYFMYSEEVDLCYRLQKGGWSLYWVPEAEIIHYGGQSTKQVAAEMFMQLYRSKLLFFRKHYGRPAAQLYKLIIGAAALARLFLIPLAWLERPPQRNEHLLLATLYRRLLAALPRM